MKILSASLTDRTCHGVYASPSAHRTVSPHPALVAVDHHVNGRAIKEGTSQNIVCTHLSQRQERIPYIDVFVQAAYMLFGIVSFEQSGEAFSRSRPPALYRHCEVDKLGWDATGQHSHDHVRPVSSYSRFPPTQQHTLPLAARDLSCLSP